MKLQLSKKATERLTIVLIIIIIIGLAALVIWLLWFSKAFSGQTSIFDVLAGKSNEGAGAIPDIKPSS